MNKLLTCLSGAVLLLAAAAAAQADPIQDDTLNGCKAGWYPNSYKEQGPLTCARTCAAWVKGAAEGEVGTKNAKQTHVCKVVNKKQKEHLYGNQFDDSPACLTSDITGKKQKSSQFYCLCVGK